MIAEVVNDHHPILSLSLVNEIFEYIHSDFKNVIYRDGNVLFDNSDYDDSDVHRRLPISVILNSNLEDYFADVLLSDQFKRKLCDICAKEGQLESLKWARFKGCPWTKPHRWRDEGTCNVAVIAGHLHILQWARQNGCDWNSNTCTVAARAGHLHILQWAREHGCDWNWRTCSAAAGGGHLHILQWAREHGRDWDWRTCSAAAGGGHWDLLVWAIRNGVPMEGLGFSLCEYAASFSRWDIVQLAVNHGCSCSDFVRLRLNHHVQE